MERSSMEAASLAARRRRVSPGGLRDFAQKRLPVADGRPPESSSDSVRRGRGTALSSTEPNELIRIGCPPSDVNSWACSLGHRARKRSLRERPWSDLRISACMRTCGQVCCKRGRGTLGRARPARGEFDVAVLVMSPDVVRKSRGLLLGHGGCRKSVRGRETGVGTGGSTRSRAVSARPGSAAHGGGCLPPGLSGLAARSTPSFSSLAPVPDGEWRFTRV
jgi:hypothetical protein